MSSVSRVFAGIEICNTRFDDSVDPPLACVVADNSNADLLVVGDALPEGEHGALADLPVTLQHRGKPDIKGTTRNVLGNPLRALTWLANWLARRGEGLKRGQLISSGSCTGMTQVAADDVVSATFGSGARVCVEFSLANRLSVVIASRTRSALEAAASQLRAAHHQRRRPHGPLHRSHERHANTALVHLTKTLSDQLGPDGITVNIIHPGVTRTEHVGSWFAAMAKSEGTTFDAIVKREAADPAAVRRMLEVEEVADCIVFLASRRASGLTGESIAVDGGLSRAGYL